MNYLQETYIRRKAGLGLLEMLFALLVILGLAYFVLTANFQKSPLDKKTQKALSEQGIDTTNYGTVMESVKQRLGTAQEDHVRALKEAVE